MAYFLGRDCSVVISTEDDTGGSSGQFLSVEPDGDFVISTAAVLSTNAQFACPLAASRVSGKGVPVADLTGVDLSIGAVDEDITYIGKRQVTKAEIKKETTVSLTRKKKDLSWDAIFNNSGRQGVLDSAVISSLQEPTVNTGYRIHVILKGSTDVFSVRNCCVQAHSTSVNADGTGEETMEFMTYVTPKVGQNMNITATTAGEL